ncbi:MAG: heme exporter protein CcmD [Proteobacteria bacterium]|nr:MAG: heme exporter protein CcmD [Pseudomonadota bacterium]
MNDFFSMSGYGAYIWWAYGLTLVALVFNVVWARRNLAAARIEARRRLAIQEEA